MICVKMCDQVKNGSKGVHICFRLGNCQLTAEETVDIGFALSQNQSLEASG